MTLSTAKLIAATTATLETYKGMNAQLAKIAHRDGRTVPNYAREIAALTTLIETDAGEFLAGQLSQMWAPSVGGPIPKPYEDIQISTPALIQTLRTLMHAPTGLGVAALKDALEAAAEQLERYSKERPHENAL